MEIKLAKNYGFCFGVKRAIEIAENSRDATTIGPLIHNNEEINRLKENFNVITSNDIGELGSAKKAIIRTHGIVKDDFKTLQKSDIEVIDATCPFVTKPQQIVEEMSKKGYKIVIFGDVNHPEVKGVMSYAVNDPIIVMSVDDLKSVNISNKVAVISQTTRKISEFQKIVNYLVERIKEVRVFNTICNATFENQESAYDLSLESDVMIVIGGKNSSNTKQLLTIAQENCIDSYLIENEKELVKEWFDRKILCGITAGASTPDWIIEKIVATIRELSVE
ncbi:MAG TPA: 4-hydroxy-3-methylbut-2-enyl diphosphate reductase [Campylobacterales bacterium]|nr:4-hydroxy-3-methylbut-2-enyl diphosphate reductase [Campylobacterales bacterium]HIP60750.1 4-hydroxy-3-methylbut-2-enyl diphosphate reductase [Campylobacterales bacterium]